MRARGVKRSDEQRRRIYGIPTLTVDTSVRTNIAAANFAPVSNVINTPLFAPRFARRRLEQMNTAVKNARNLGEFYIRIQEVMLSNPAKDKNHLDALTQQLSLARQQQADLLHRRNSLYAEKERIEKKDKPKYLNEIRKARIKKHKIEPQVEAQKKNLAMDPK